MDTNPQHFNRSTACLALAALLLAAGAWLNVRWFGDPHSPMTEGPFYLRKVHAPAAFDLVMGGNSRVLQSLSPAAMAEELPGRRILNLGLDGACLAPQFCGVLASKLDPASPAPALLLGIEPGTLEEYSSANRKLNVELGRSGEAKFLAWHGEAWVRWFAPVRPFKILNRVSLAWHGPTTEQPLIHNECYPDGWMAAYREPEDVERMLALYRVEHGDETAGGPRIPLPFKEPLLEQVRQWTAAGVRVYGVRIPAAPELIAYEDRHYEFDAPDLVRRFREAGGVWLDIDPAPYRTYDGSHLHKASAVEFSRTVARAIRNAEGASAFDP